jgi:hypothetical protein
MEEPLIPRKALDAFRARLCTQLAEVVNLAISEFEHENRKSSSNEAGPSKQGIVEEQDQEPSVDVDTGDILVQMRPPKSLQVGSMITGSDHAAPAAPGLCEAIPSSSVSAQAPQVQARVEDGSEAYVAPLVNLNKRDSHHLEEEDHTAMEAVWVGRLFKECDKDKSGIVSVEELLEVIHAKHGNTSGRKSVTSVSSVTQDNVTNLTEAVVALNMSLGDRHAAANDGVVLTRSGQ